MAGGGEQRQWERSAPFSFALVLITHSTVFVVPTFCSPQFVRPLLVRPFSVRPFALARSGVQARAWVGLQQQTVFFVFRVSLIEALGPDQAREAHQTSEPKN